MSGKSFVKTGLNALARTLTIPAFSPIFIMPSHNERTPVRPIEVSNAVLEESNVESTIALKIVVSPITNCIAPKMKAITKNAIQI